MRIILADDHELVRAGIRPFLEELAEDVEVIEAETYHQALAAAGNGGESAALAILDLRMPDREADSIGGFHRAHPGIPVVVLSGSMDLQDVYDALSGGAVGYIPKTFGGPAMLHALRLVLAGERFFPAFAVEAALQRGLPTAGGGNIGNRDANGGRVLDKLSAREREILALMIEGGTNKEIARRLEVQEITVKVHLRNIYRKLGAANRAQAVRIALENGWQAPPMP